MATIESPLPPHSDFQSAFEEPPPSLGDKILERLERSKFDTKQEFLPEGCLDKLINPQALKQELFYEKDILDPKDESLLNFINKNAKKVFATAYCALGGSESTLVATMAYFQSLEFSDKCLPIKDLRTDQTMRNAPAQLPFPFNQLRPRIISRTWAPMRVRNFYQHQWKFLAPIFTRDHFHHILPVDVVLPFVWVNNVVKGGRFSSVYEVEVHRSHLERLDARADGTSARVAVKEILTTDNDEDLRQEIEMNFHLEANALSDIASLQHDHIIERIAAISLDARHYFMFQWADGGNLREFWKENPRPDITPAIVRQSISELRGLADALTALHHFKGEGNYRHGDLKPENVLRFKDGTFVGRLKIADMGLAKRHTEVTDVRRAPTDTKYGTTRYEPPETVTSPLEARSRLYDVWSLGCIILEYIIWLLYGCKELEAFIDGLLADTGSFYFIQRGENRTKAEVHPMVLAWMDYISNDLECSARTAIQDLLALVREKLLVVSLQGDKDTRVAIDTSFVSVTADFPNPTPVGPLRARAAAVVSLLQEIMNRGVGHDDYFLAKRNNLGVRFPSVGIGRKLNHTWDFYVDNTLAEHIIRYCGNHDLDLSLARIRDLCRRCERLDILSSDFSLSDTISHLRRDAQVCGFCRLLLKASEKAGASEHMRLYRIGSILKIDDVPTPLLSLVRNPGGVSGRSSKIQVGYPHIFPSRHEVHFEIIRQWIDDCDISPAHENCRSTETYYLPDKLLDVQDFKVRLVETKDLQDKYFALSHPWGDPEEHSHFCTNTSNIAQHMEGIDYDKLPNTFRDAIYTTRKLGVRYLWIDSLCIVQGPDGDFHKQSKSMHEIFSSAYCVLAASRATGQCDGFLGKRLERDYITFNRGEDMYHICEEIDNFQADVIDGSLNRRGWVLQERVLARRTIYFTETQTYWECGAGVRCETFTKLKSDVASFLGDPKFPRASKSFSRGEIIYHTQALYKQYSSLQLSRIQDRPFAIAGLEKILMRFFCTQGGYGVFDDGKGLLFRSLLWHRPDRGTLNKIRFQSDRQIFVPTWSWMAYEGVIDYLQPTWGGVDWEVNDIRSPWMMAVPTATRNSSNSSSRGGSSIISINAIARDFDTYQAGDDLFFDIPSQYNSQTPGLKCVILARPKPGSTATDLRCYVLLVAPQVNKTSGSLTVFERVGVGRMPESCVSQLDKIEVKLQ
ncbi:hypothetical protein GCG54_00013180 [Colletotrichum gloeosporioides]|uniref:Protein kinase domain-containing protein n=1 Tax=Colletotrichum gloeosporioides TaxID=474922 RepID=A0A8H4FE23_COLGL|nr:uncharacterized protein GCG54_00013180 [Colletotrichum gloeosporioides]KAF3798440.1 hypothetical protein GCG54_00013180 [Colletotrichum gloeosporioides]